MKPKLSIFKSCNLLISLFFILHLSFLVYNCRDKPTPPPDDYQPGIFLSAEDIGVTDAFIRVRFVDTTVSRAFKLTRDGQTILSAQCSSLDTLILDEGLLPNSTYKYKAYRLLNSTLIDSSAELFVPTLDTSSHNYIFQIDTLGDGNNSVLRDVAIINDTCIWVVGEIKVKDSLGNWINPPYNYAFWNGHKWNINCSFETGYGYGALYAVFAFSPTDVWVGSTIPEHWDGAKWTFYGSARGFPTGFYINKIWGTSSKNLYIVGTGGNIIHYNGSSWQKMNSGTDLDFTDVWGSPDGSVVWTTGYYSDQAGTYVFKYDGTSWKMVYDGTNSRLNLTPDSISGVISTVWANSNDKVYVGAGAGIFVCDIKAKWKSKLITPFGWLRTLPHGMRANDINDIFIVGTYGFIGHYNGYTSKEYSQFWGTGRPFSSVSQRGNLVCAVGNLSDPINSKGLVFMGRR